MIKKIRQFIFSILLLVSLFLSTASFVHAGSGIDKFNKSLQDGATRAGHDTSIKASKAGVTIYVKIANSIQVLLELLGIIFIVLIIYAGYTWMLARGNEADAQKAKDTITRAIIGLAIVLGAYAITTFIGGKL